MLDDLAATATFIQENQERFLELLSEHLQLTILSVVIGLLVALPLAVIASRIELLAKPLTWLAAIGQTIPSLAILGLMLPFLGTGFMPSLFALTIRAILPIFLNGYVGIRSTDPAIVDAARGMGTGDAQLLLMVELPLALLAMVAELGLSRVQRFVVPAGLQVAMR